MEPEKQIDDKPLGIKGMLGVGLDGDGEHKRLTKGKNFLLVGGSHPTHERMQEFAVRFNEDVRERGKPLENITGRELGEITQKLIEKMK